MTDIMASATNNIMSPIMDTVIAVENIVIDTASMVLTGNVLDSISNPPAAYDPDFDSVVLLSHFDGADLSQVFIDESNSTHVISPDGNPCYLSTAQKVFGTAALTFGTDDFASIPDSDDFHFGTDPFTIEGRFYWNTIGTGYQCLIGKWESPNKEWALYYNVTSNELIMFVSVDGITSLQRAHGSFNPTDDTWYAIAVDRDASNKYRIYVGGSMVGSETATDDIRNGTAILGIGARSGGADGYFGRVDELRVTNGVARYASDSGYTIATEAFPHSFFGVLVSTGDLILTPQVPAIIGGVPTGTLWTSGFGYLGYLGDGTTVDKSSPVQVGALTNWTDIASSGSGYHAGATNESGELFMWGNGDSGRLGDGTAVDKSSPVQVGALTDWSQLALTLATSLAIKTDGTLWSWGDGSDYILGSGDLTDLSSPAQVGALTDWGRMDAGYKHMLAIKTDGTLWVWGRNYSGELGNGSTTIKTTPFQIGALTNWAQVSAGNEISAAIKTDGTLWTWGDAASGKLGNGTTTPNISSPVQIGALTDWAQVSCGGDHMIAVKTDGTLWVWGLNTYGALGDGTVVAKSSPVQVGALTDWEKVDCGDNGQTSGAIKTDGTLWTWGDANKGGTGQSTEVDVSSPVQVGALTDYAFLAFGASQMTVIRNV